MKHKGSVWTRPDSPYYWGSVMIKGVRQHMALSDNKALAEKILQEWKEQKKGRKGHPIAWLAFKLRYLEWARANKCRNTVYRDRLSMEYLEEFCNLKNLPLKFLADITPLMLEDFKTHLKIKADATYSRNGSRKRERGAMSVHGINRTLQSLKAVVKRGEEMGFMSPDIKWDKIRKFKTPKGRIEFFTPEEVRMLLDEAAILAEESSINYSPWTTVILLGARAGLRRGEMHHLEWSDINFENNILTVQPKKDWHPKDFECRDVPLSEDLREHLLSIPRRGDYVVYDRYGYRFSIDSLTNYFAQKICKRSGIKGNIHKLRHTFASHLVQRRVSLYEVKELLGHSSITTTEIYAHLAPNNLHNAISHLPVLPVQTSYPLPQNLVVKNVGKIKIKKSHKRELRSEKKEENRTSTVLERTDFATSS